MPYREPARGSLLPPINLEFWSTNRVFSLGDDPRNDWKYECGSDDKS